MNYSETISSSPGRGKVSRLQAGGAGVPVLKGEFEGLLVLLLIQVTLNNFIKNENELLENKNPRLPTGRRGFRWKGHRF